MAHVTGEDAHEIRRRGFMLTGPEDSGEHVADASDPAIFTTAPHEEPFQREGRPGTLPQEMLERLTLDMQMGT